MKNAKALVLFNFYYFPLLPLLQPPAGVARFIVFSLSAAYDVGRRVDINLSEWENFLGIFDVFGKMDIIKGVV